jgi:hypothetical protein
MHSALRMQTHRMACRAVLRKQTETAPAGGGGGSTYRLQIILHDIPYLRSLLEQHNIGRPAGDNELGC